MKKFLMYGAGNIGRGFIGQIFSNAGYKVGFVDINKAVISALNEKNEYPVNVVTTDENTEIMVKNVYGIDGSDLELVSDEIASCELMATAIGVNVLKFIAKPIAMGIAKRAKSNRPPLNIIICENLIGADEFLKGLIKKEIPEHEEYIENNVGFVEASIGRMVPVVTEEKKMGNPLRVYVEPYNVLPVDKSAFKGEIVTDVPNLYPFSPFNLFIQRKLFMHNMSHALCAYLGNLRGYEYIYQTVKDLDIKYVAFKALSQMAVAISKENNTDIKMLMDHADNLLFRFKNEALGDTVARVGRDTKRKLSGNDRLVGALKLAEKHDVNASYLCIGITAGMMFCTEGDDSSIELCEYAKQNGVAKTLIEYGQYEGKYVGLIDSLYKKMKEGETLKNILNYLDEINNQEIRV